jgi:replicative DNA helicase
MPFEGSDARFAAVADRRAMPVNVECEQSLLGAILINNAAYTRVADRLHEEHFGTPVHGRIFAACGKLIERGVPANVVTLRNRFEADESLTDIGGAMYLARLAEAAVTVLNAEHYANTIIDCWRRRELIGLADDIDRRAREVDYDDPADRIAEAAGSALDALLSDSRGGVAGEAKQGLTGAGVAAAAAMERAQAAYRGDGAAGTVMSGIESFDRLTGGFQNGDLIYIGKRPSMGGTAFVVTVG